MGIRNEKSLVESLLNQSTRRIVSLRPISMSQQLSAQIRLSEMRLIKHQNRTKKETSNNLQGAVTVCFRLRRSTAAHRRRSKLAKAPIGQAPRRY